MDNLTKLATYNGQSNETDNINGQSHETGNIKWTI